MQFNKNDFQSIFALICLVICLITMISINYMWLFAPYGQARNGLIKIFIVNALCVAGVVYSKKTLKIDFSKKNKPKN